MPYLSLSYHVFSYLFILRDSHSWHTTSAPVFMYALTSVPKAVLVNVSIAGVPMAVPVMVLTIGVPLAVPMN